MITYTNLDRVGKTFLGLREVRAVLVLMAAQVTAAIKQHEIKPLRRA